MRIRENVNWTDLTIATHQWMKSEGYVRNREEHRISTFVREQWAERFAAEYGIIPDDWLACYLHCYKQGIFIGYTTGFYLSDDARDVASSMCRLFNTAIALLKTYFQLIEALESSGSWEAALPGFWGRQHLQDWVAVEQLMDAAQIPASLEMKKALLAAKSAVE